MAFDPTRPAVPASAMTVSGPCLLPIAVIAVAAMTLTPTPMQRSSTSNIGWWMSNSSAEPGRRVPSRKRLPGTDSKGDGHLEFGGWLWRYDLVPLGSSETEVTLTHDWSAVPQFIREYLHFPPFGPEHLSNSLRHLAELAAPASQA